MPSLVLSAEHPRRAVDRTPPRRAVDPPGIRAAARRVVNVVAFGVLPVVLTLSLLAVTFGSKSFLYDFHGGLYGAGRAIAHGSSPYDPGYLQLQAAVKRAGGSPQTVIDVPVYPPPVLLASVPFSLLPFRVAGLLFAALSIGGLMLALRLLEVRDWRCYGAALGCWPVLSGLRLGALSPLIVLGAAIAWRWRGKVGAPAASLASIVAAKLFPWTLGAWLLVTRRFRTLALAILLAAVGTLAAWAVIDFRGMSDYPQMLANLSFVSESTGVSLVAGLLALGVSAALAKALALVATAVLLGLAWRFARQPGGDARAFGLTVVAALTASPMIWPHYLGLVLIPIALLSPRLSPIWFVPLLAYLAPVAQTHGNIWEILPYLTIEAIVVLALCARRPVQVAGASAAVNSC